MFMFRNEPYTSRIPFVHDWIDSGEFLIQNKNYIYIDNIKTSLNLTDNDPLPYFNLSKKKSYNGDELRETLVHYVNYFLTFFDNEKELLYIYKSIKIKIDCSESYTPDDLYNDLTFQLLSPIMIQKTFMMNEYNSLTLDVKHSKYIKDKLRYDKNHLILIHHISILMRMAIPLLAHYIYKRGEYILSNSKFLLDFYYRIFRIFDINIEQKLIATTENKVYKSTQKDFRLWQKQSIQGINSLTHSLVNLSEVITCVLPKIKYDKSAYHLIDVAIKNNIENHIIKKTYDFEYLKFSNNNNTEFDNFEIPISNSSEAVLVYSQANADLTTNMLFEKYHIDDDLVDYYYKELSEGGANIMNGFQEKIIFNLFYKYYGDVISIKNINNINYIRLMLIAKKILQSENLNILAEMISAKVINISSRKDLNKKEKSLLESSELYNEVLKKYNYDERIVNDIRSMIATSITTEFLIIDPNSQACGTILPINPHVIIYQLLSYITLI